MNANVADKKKEMRQRRPISFELMRFTIALENSNDDDKAREGTPIMQRLTTMTEREQGGGQWCGWGMGEGGVRDAKSKTSNVLRDGECL